MTEMIRAVRRAVALAPFLVLFGAEFGFGAPFGLGASPASAQQVSCNVRVDGQPTSSHTAPRHALALDVDSVHRVQATAPPDATHVRVEVETPIGTRAAVESVVTGGQEYDNPNVRLDKKVAPYGVGLYRVHVTAGSCDEVVWVRLTGRSPFTTASGIAGAAAVLVGVVLIGFGVVRAAQGRGGIVRGAIGGAIGGAGALLLSQQFGWIGITPAELVSWVVAPAFGGAAITGLTSVMSGGAAAGSGASGAGAAGGGAAAAPPPPAPAAPAPAPPPPAAPAPAPPPPTAARATADRGTRASADRGGSRFAARAFGRGAGDRRRGGSAAQCVCARMDAPEAVVAADEFMLVVGLAPEPVAGVINPQIVRPASSVGPYTLDIQVVADGFSLAEGEWRRQLPVTAAAAYPTTTYKLRADAQPADVWSRPIQALYSIDGQTVGVAIRTIADRRARGAAALGSGRRCRQPRVSSRSHRRRTRPTSPRASPTAKRSPTVGCCGRSRRRTTSRSHRKRSSRMWAAGRRRSRAS